MARTLPHAPAGSRGLTSHPDTLPPLGGTHSHPLLTGTRALIPLPVDFSTLLSALSRGREDYSTVPRRGQAAAAPRPPSPAEPRVPVDGASVPTCHPAGKGSVRGHPCHGWSPASPLLSFQRGEFQNLPVLLPILETFFFFLGGACNFCTDGSSPAAGAPTFPRKCFL